MPIWRGILFFAAALVACRSVFAITPSNVLVLYNSASTEGAEIANYYAQAHPGVRLLGIDGVGTAEEISADSYLSQIRPQVLAALDPSVDAIVTTKGLPLRITQGSHTNPGTYTDPQGNQRTIWSSTWKPFSSLESELTRIDTISTWQMMGDQAYWLPNSAHFSSNPYHAAGAPFDHEIYGTRLATRLDGFSVADVQTSIDRAQRAVISRSGSGTTFAIDDDPTKTYDLMPQLVNNVLAPALVSYTFDQSSAFLGDVEGNVLGYVSHGRHQPSTPGNYVNALQFSIADGAVFHSWESFNAYSFVEGHNRAGQALVGQWLAIGGTAALGNVEEPGASSSTITNEDIFFEMMLGGKTFAEAAWGATRQLSYVNTMVGDPLMIWRVLGDMDGNHLLDNQDIQTFELALTNSAAYLEQYPDLTDFRIRGDANMNGVFDNHDITSFEELLTGVATNPDDASAVPEPSSCLLLGLALVLLAPRVLRTSRRPASGLSLSPHIAV